MWNCVDWYIICAENVNEYLRLSAMDDSNVDRQQAQRVKAAFEKRNQKSTQTIAQLQRKLEMYTGRLRELDETGVLYSGGSRHAHRQARTVLKDVGQGIRLNVCSLPTLVGYSVATGCLSVCPYALQNTSAWTITTIVGRHSPWLPHSMSIYVNGLMKQCWLQ